MQYADEFEQDDEFVEGDLPNFRLQSSTEFDNETGAEAETREPEQAAVAAAAVPATRQYTVPDVIRNFILYFHQKIRDRSVHEIHSIYENSFNKLTERYYKESPWPHVDFVSTLVGGDKTFLMLYKELYYRHIYSKLQVTHEHRVESWRNYCDFFDFLLQANTAGSIELELPFQWLWDIVDEFIYQFQACAQHRAKVKAKAHHHDDDPALSNPDIWSLHGVLHYLQALINKSRIIQTLDRDRARQQKEAPVVVDEAGGFAMHGVYKMLGYYSIIGLARVHSLLADYHLALRILRPIDLSNKKGLFTRVTACYITLHYYVGFAYMMMRRYVDATKTFAAVLLHISRTKQYHTRSYHYEFMKKHEEQMYALLAIGVALCPQRIDENVHASLKQAYADKIIRMQRGEEQVFEELFAYACPKFIVPPAAASLYAAAAEETTDNAAGGQNATSRKLRSAGLRAQLRQFLKEVRQQTLLPTVRSFLKLYSTIPAHKLAAFLDVQPATLPTLLLTYKHKTRNLVWSADTGAFPNGKWVPASDVEFRVDQDMVVIADSKITRRYGDFFMRHIGKLDEIIHDVTPSTAQQPTNTRYAH